MLSLFVWLALSEICYGYATPTGPPTPCDPLVPDVCIYPFPNDFWLTTDPTTHQPLNLSFTTDNFPVADLPIKGQTISPFYWNKLDGFSPIPAILTYFGNDLSILNCAPLWNISMSLDDNASIILLDGTLNNNEKLAYWTELDHSSDTDISSETNKSLMIWPSKRLIDGHNYIVGIRNLYNNGGDLIKASEGFIDLRDNITSNNEAIEFRRKKYDDYIFPILEANGFNRNNLLLAWDFTVQSTKTQTNTMVSMRDDAFKRIKNNNIEYRIASIEQNPYNNMARKIHGFMKVPWYLNQRSPGMDVRIVRNKDDWFGLPQYQKDEEVEFEMLIPNSLANGSMSNQQTRFLQYGHGLFGSYKEINTQYLRDYANEYGYILAGVNWLGLCYEDVVFVTEMITVNITNFAMIPDRLHQGMLNALYLMKLMLSSKFIADDSIFKFGDVNVLPSTPPYKRNYYGNSCGGLMGTVYMSLTTDVTHGTVGVVGGPFSLLLPRSVDFSGFFDDIKVRYSNDIDRIFLISLFQLLWNSLEPAGYINHINKNLFDNTPMHSILIHFSLGDAQVTWLGAEIIGREMGCYMYKSQSPEYNETLSGFDFVDDSFTINTVSNNGKYAGKCLIQGWNYNEPQVPFINKPPLGQDTHEFTRRQDDSQAANYKFWNEGIIYNPCNGTCDGHPTIMQYNNFTQHAFDHFYSA